MSKKAKRRLRKRLARTLTDLGIIVNLVVGILNVIILIMQLAG